jgi:hypothetical protein
MLALCTLAGTAPSALCAGAPQSNPYTYLHHRVSTDIPAAQFAFDRGLKGDAAAAAKTFRDGLRLSPHDPRLLLGLSEAESVLGNTSSAETARREFTRLWLGSRSEAKVADF